MNQSKLPTDTRFSFRLDGFQFERGEGELPTGFNGIAMGGNFVVDTWFGEQLIRPETWLSEDGKVLPLSVDHRRFPTLGTFTVRVTKRQIKVTKGRFHQTDAATAELEEMMSLIEGGVNLEMSIGGFYDPDSERKTTKSEDGDFTFDRGILEEASIVLTGAAPNTKFMSSQGEPTRFAMSADWLPRKFDKSENGVYTPTHEPYKLTAEEQELFARQEQLEEI